MALDFEEKGRAGKIELLTALTEALFGAKNKSCSAPGKSGRRGREGGRQKEVFGRLDHLSCCHGGHKPVQQFVRWRYFKGDHCHMPSAPRRDQYISRQFDLDPCTHLVNVICQTSHGTGNVRVVGVSVFVRMGGRSGGGGFNLELLVAGPSRLLGATH